MVTNSVMDQTKNCPFTHWFVDYNRQAWGFGIISVFTAVLSEPEVTIFRCDGNDGMGMRACGHDVVTGVHSPKYSLQMRNGFTRYGCVDIKICTQGTYFAA